MPSRLPSLRTLLAAALLVPVLAQSAAAEPSGPFLAARAATTANDYRAAAGYYNKLLLAMPQDGAVQEGALVSQVAVGDVGRAVALSDLLTASDGASQIAVLVNLAASAKKADFAAGVALLDRGLEGGDLISGLYRAWALVAAGQMSDADKAFDKVGTTPGLRGFAAYHKALALAMVGDYEGADKIFSGDAAALLHGTRRGILAHLQVLSQLERGPDAVKLLDSAFGDNLDPELTALRARLEAGETVPFTIVRSATDGVAETFFTVAQALNSEGPSVVGLIHARLAAYLRPDFGDAHLLCAAVLEGQDQYDLAIEAYAQVPKDSPVYPAAELGRAAALSGSERNGAAIEVLEALGRSHPELGAVWVSLGDALRREERYNDAVDAYDKAVALVKTPGPRDWFIYFARGIAQERLKHWDQSETDLRKALELSPEQPAVLNYLGYSYVERKINLDEALAMIERAVAARPEDGYIIDSLGWAQFRLGRYDEAVVQMEKAVELEPTEPLLNDHLGDVYWAAGRKREAQFQWRRALNLGPGEDLDMDRARRKLEIGLDAVLQEEGAAPLHPVHAAD